LVEGVAFKVVYFCVLGYSLDYAEDFRTDQRAWLLVAVYFSCKFGCPDSEGMEDSARRGWKIGAGGVLNFGFPRTLDFDLNTVRHGGDYAIGSRRVCK